MTRASLIFVIITTLIAAPALSAAGGKESATFRATMSGEIEGGPQAHVNSITQSSTQVVIRLMPADLSLLTDAVAGGAGCFWQRGYEGPLTVERAKNGEAVARYWFTARGTDSVTEVKYVLEMKGVFDDGSNWLPASGTSVRMLVSAWSVAPESKGQGRIACGGSGTVTGTAILIERLP